MIKSPTRSILWGLMKKEKLNLISIPVFLLVLWLSTYYTVMTTGTPRLRDLLTWTYIEGFLFLQNVHQQQPYGGIKLLQM